MICASRSWRRTPNAWRAVADIVKAPMENRVIASPPGMTHAIEYGAMLAGASNAGGGQALRLWWVVHYIFIIILSEGL